MDGNVELIKRQVIEALAELGISPHKIVLFGSMARGDDSYDSDCDLLVITKEELSGKERIKISERIRDRLARLRIPSDIIVSSQKEAEYLKDKIGSVVREALREGVPL